MLASRLIYRVTCTGAVLTACLLTGCSTFSSSGKKIDYRSAGEVAGLEVPPDLAKPRVDDRFNMPGNVVSVKDLNNPGTATASNLGALPKFSNITVERAGAERWLVVDAKPDQLWFSLKDFWQELGFIINIDDPQVGVLETDWAENRAKIKDDPIRGLIGSALDSVYSTDERDKFRTRIETRADGKTEIYISHRGMYETYTEERSNKTMWQPRPSDTGLEAEMLTRLMVRLGTDDASARTRVANSQASAERAKLANGGIQNAEDFDRTWRRVGLVLDRTGFTVVDRDRKQGLYYVSYAEVEDPTKNDEGFLSKLAFWSDKKEKQKIEAVQYRVGLRPQNGGTFIQVLSKTGQADDSKVAKKITALIFDQLK